MSDFKFRRTITVEYLGDWEIVKPKMKENLDSYFNSEGFYNSMENNELIYKRNFNSATEVVMPSSRNDFFKVLTNIRIRIINIKENSIELEFIADLRYLIIFSFAIGLVFSLGFYPLFLLIGPVNYLAVALSIAFISGLIGYLSIRFKIAYQYYPTKK